MPKLSKSETIKQSSIFFDLSERELAELSLLAIWRNFAPGAAIFREGEAPHWFYIVAEGKVKAFKESSLGKEFIITFFGPGEMFGEVAIFENKPYPASAQAVSETRVLGLRREEFLTFLSGHSQVVLRIISILGGRLRDAQSRLGDMAGERVEQRLARILVMLSANLGPELPFTREEIADMTGTTTETTIRIMSRLRDGGIIRTTRGRIVILDGGKLRLLSEGPPEV